MRARGAWLELRKSPKTKGIPADSLERNEARRLLSVNESVISHWSCDSQRRSIELLDVGGVSSMLVIVGFVSVWRSQVPAHDASPTAELCGDYLDLEGEKDALVLVQPDLDVIWLDRVTIDDGDGNAGDTVQVLLASPCRGGWYTTETGYFGFLGEMSGLLSW